MTSGIYCIENIVDGKVYIGQTIDLARRKRSHFNKLNIGKHPNKHLQNAFNKYGSENFKFKVLLYCESFELTRYEQFFVNSTKNSSPYNLRLECVDSSLGILQSEETRQKISEAKKGKPSWNKGIPHSETSIQKMRDAQIGRKPSEETRRKMSEARKGKKASEETRRKMSEAGKGRVTSEESKQKNSDAHKGKKASEETKCKMSHSRLGNTNSKGRHLSEETKQKIQETKRRKRNGN